MGKGGKPDADTLRGFRQQQKKARAAVQAQAEAYTEILERSFCSRMKQTCIRCTMLARVF